MEPPRAWGRATGVGTRVPKRGQGLECGDGVPQQIGMKPPPKWGQEPLPCNKDTKVGTITPPYGDKDPPSGDKDPRSVTEDLKIGGNVPQNGDRGPQNRDVNPQSKDKDPQEGMGIQNIPRCPQNGDKAPQEGEKALRTGMATPGQMTPPLKKGGNPTKMGPHAPAYSP